MINRILCIAQCMPTILLLVADTHVPKSYEEVVYGFSIEHARREVNVFFWQLYGYAVAQGCGVLSVASDE